MPDPLSAFALVRRKRARLRKGGTDALRLLDSAGDGPEFSGLSIDDFAGRWLVQTHGPAQPPPAWLASVSPAPRSVYWKQLGSKEAPIHWAGEEIGAPFVIQENGLQYLADFKAGYSQGLFIDQRDNRLEVRRRAAASGIVLNCFAYTGGFSVAAAAGGAGTVSVDLSRRSLDWGRENFALNGLNPGAGHEFLAGDVFDWLKRFAKRERRFEGIVLDPPTFSRNRQGSVFRVEDDFTGLVALAATLLTPAGWLLCTTNQRSFAEADFRKAVRAGLPQGGWSLVSAPMPADFTGEPYLRTVWVARRQE